ncbi:MAG: TerB family tellurite resistance protein [Candidatus Marinimicrobia bacterium]|jgi:hypothetical protein|nr:TerB family tellurite resistance protein [Candidatus Neomarinimicrobiota bacterium]MBT3495567.1 TerB family tellurite resistance protein [Candidatus Neomarinimicrobiota bacterium]MBT3732575.1 TerB family tellurite resistance protein [Candidatus Neomarinimicrobiota bacterium]MBT4144380.1 TerB family tellurite resistance protein [Candidatus Neomarinimicrobiota bacterium]MBT4177447.1 TerB family tellurite resistance protein [Candidatus Neomarinimicrobiota bacterium]
MINQNKTRPIFICFFILSILNASEDINEGFYTNQLKNDTVQVFISKGSLSIESKHGTKYQFNEQVGQYKTNPLFGEIIYKIKRVNENKFQIIENQNGKVFETFTLYAKPGLFKKLISILVSSALLFSIMQAYLKVNKIWKRRKNEEVANSISIVAALLGFAVGIPFLLNNIFITHDFFSAGKVVLGLSLASIFTLIGAGYFVEANRNTGLFKLFTNALNLEKKESGELLSAMLRPKGAQKIIDILTKLAAIDDDIAQEEIDLINEFAERWHIDIPKLKAGKPEQVTNLMELKELVQSYLDEKPDLDVASGLTDLIHLMAEADDEVTEEEAMAIAEFTGMISHYISVEKGGDVIVYDVNIIPQGDDQIQSVKELLPDLDPVLERSGKVFKVGSFFSEDYANAICQKYISFGLYTDFTKRTLPSEDY